MKRSKASLEERIIVGLQMAAQTIELLSHRCMELQGSRDEWIDVATQQNDMLQEQSKILGEQSERLLELVEGEPELH